MIRTRGLTHVALDVRDPERSFRFYKQIFGLVRVYADADFVQAQTPGSWDVIVFQRAPGKAGKRGGVAHFGFRLVDAADISEAIVAIERAGGKVLESGDFSPGEPYVFFEDLDGNQVEVWYELPTPIDPT